MLSWLKNKIHKRAYDKKVLQLRRGMGIAQDLREANDFGSLKSFDVDTHIEGLNGFEERVNIARTDKGIIFLKQSNGEPISSALSLEQKYIDQIPADMSEGVFVSFVIRSKYKGVEDELRSCLIDADGTPYGDKRAFWWSLSRVNLNTMLTKISHTRMTAKSFEQVRIAAKGVWESALEHDKSIDNMRDSLVMVRDLHLGVFANLKEQFKDSPASVFGIEVVSTMVLATQSQDLKLEKFAFDNLRQFIWMPGEEPPEFLANMG